MQDMKAMMDNLMGNDRNAGKREEKKASWRDNTICKGFLVWECPCDFFISESGRVAPKSPFGECCKQHSEAMKIRFKEDKDFRRCNHRYLEDLEKQLQPKIKALDDKVAAEKEALIIKIEAKDISDAKTQIEDGEKHVESEQIRARRKNEQDEICEVCGTYSAFTGALIMRHDAGILHVGWARLRESFANLKKEVKACKEGLTSDELRGPVEGQTTDQSRSIDVRETREQGRDNRHGQKDVNERGDRDRNKDKDMPREFDLKSRADKEYDQKSRGRERDTNSERHRDRHDDRRGHARDRDRGRRHGDEIGNSRRGRSRKEEDVDEFGRGKTIQSDYRDGRHETDKDTRKSRSRSRGNKKVKSPSPPPPAPKSPSPPPPSPPPKSTGTWRQDTKDFKILQIELGEDWQEVMNQKCQESKLSMTEWDMTCIDCKNGVLDMDAKDTAFSAHSFPLKFYFTRKAFDSDSEA